MSRLLERVLFDFKKNVDNFKGRDVMIDLVQERLDKSFELYCSKLEEVCGYVLKKDPFVAMRKINK